MDSSLSPGFPAAIDPEPRLPYGERPLPDYLACHARDRPAETAFNYYGRRVTYAEFDAAVDAFAGALAERGYGPDDAIVLYLHNVPQFSIALLGAQRLGVVPATPMPDGDEDLLEHYVERTDSRGLVIHDTHAETSDAVSERTGLEDVFYVRYETYLPEQPELPLPDQIRSAADEPHRDTDGNAVYLSDVVDEGAEPPPTDRSLDDRAMFMFTGGTTGRPKTVPFTYRDNLIGAASLGSAWELYDHGSHLLVYNVQRSPLFFSVLPQVVFGNTVVMLEQPEDEVVMGAIDAFDVEISMFRSPLVKRILDHPDRDSYDLTSMERLACLSFQTELTEEMADRWQAVTGSPTYEYTWGAVELHGTATFGNRMPVYEPGFVGIPLHGVDVVVRDIETAEPLPVGEVGELTVDHPAMCDGYHGNPEKTAEAFRDGFFYSSDLGRLTDEGYVYYLGRKREMIRVAGEHVAPRSIERLVESHHAVDSAGVVGVERGSEVALVCAVTLERTASTEDLERWIGEHVDEPYRRPDEVVHLDALPVSNVGKLDRDALEERLT